MVIVKLYIKKKTRKGPYFDEMFQYFIRTYDKKRLNCTIKVVKQFIVM